MRSIPNDVKAELEKRFADAQRNCPANLSDDGRYVVFVSAAENLELDLPDPDKSLAARVKLTDRVVINCLPAHPLNPAGGRTIYSVGPLRVSSLQELSQRLAAAKLATPNLQVVLRADRRLPYATVREVMQIIAQNQIEVMNIVAHAREGDRR